MYIDFSKIFITRYEGVRDTIGRKTSLYAFLTRTENDKIKQLRESTDPMVRKQIKLSLPQATISGLFYPTRAAENLVQHSGLICVDIDHKDNEHIEHFDTLLVDVIRNIQEVAYASRSVSGEGYFLIIPLKYPARHKQHFDALIEDFANLGINIDRACGDVCRLRCQSYDLQSYYNPDAKPYSRMKFPQVPSFSGGCCDGSEEEKVARLCREIAARHIDLTASYDDWMRIGASLASLGERGRQYFHLVSAQNVAYNPADCDRKFANLLRTTSRISLGTFFHLCRQSGVY